MHPPLTYDWNRIGAPEKPVRVMLNDETLRDGLQSPSVRTPTVGQKLEILHLIDRLGIDNANIGLPGAGTIAMGDAERLAREIVEAKLNVRPNCAARTAERDITPIIEISQKTGIPIEVGMFIGSSPIRQYTEGWDLDWLLRTTERSVSLAVDEGLPVMYVTEDTTRSDPETLRKLYLCAIRAGARRICVADTVGHATPHGAAAVVRFTMQVIRESGVDVAIDWHGHRDRDLALINSIAALEAGATRIHATALGIGERVGNTPMDVLLVNLVVMGFIKRDLSLLMQYAQKVSEACAVQIPENYPVVGKNAFRTASGAQAMAVVKALERRQQEVEVGPMSGRSNVACWLEQRGINYSEPALNRVVAKAKSSTTVLTEAEILAEIYR